MTYCSANAPLSASPLARNDPSPSLRLNICSTGNPKKPQTWSGTPYNLYRELDRRGACAIAFDADPHPAIRKPISLAASVIYQTDDLPRTPIRRLASSWKTVLTTARSRSKCTLHTGTLSLPLPGRRPRGQKHFLYCDSTWNLWSRHATENTPASKRLAAIFESLDRRSYSQVDHIFPISEYVGKNLIEIYGVPPEKVTVVGTGLGAIKALTGEKNYTNKKILFTAKRRFRDKGGHLVVEAFRKARAVDPELSLTIVGGAEADEYRYEPGITVLGFIPLEELQNLFDTHTLFLMPALNEPWGLVYLEAMNTKMPIVGLNRNSFPELSGHGRFGFGVNVPTPDAVAGALVKAFSDPDRLKAMGEAAQIHCAAHYSWKLTVDRILNVVGRYVE